MIYLPDINCKTLPHECQNLMGSPPYFYWAFCLRPSNTFYYFVRLPVLPAPNFYLIFFCPPPALCGRAMYIRCNPRNDLHLFEYSVCDILCRSMTKLREIKWQYISSQRKSDAPKNAEPAGNWIVFRKCCLQCLWEVPHGASINGVKRRSREGARGLLVS